MGEFLGAHHVVGLEGALEIYRAPEREADAHPEVLRPFTDDADGILEKIGFLHSLEAEVVQKEVAFIVNPRINEGAMGFHYRDEFVADIGEWLSVGCALLGQFFDGGAERGAGILLVIADDDARGHDTIVRIGRGQVGGNLGR